MSIIYKWFAIHLQCVSMFIFIIHTGQCCLVSVLRMIMMMFNTFLLYWIYSHGFVDKYYQSANEIDFFLVMLDLLFFMAEWNWNRVFFIIINFEGFFVLFYLSEYGMRLFLEITHCSLNTWGINSFWHICWRNLSLNLRFKCEILRRILSQAS